MIFWQCLYSVYSNHASYFLPSCSFSDHGLGFSFIRGFCLPGISFCSFVSFSVQSFPTLPEKIRLYEKEELQNFPATVPSAFLPKTCSCLPIWNLRLVLPSPLPWLQHVDIAMEPINKSLWMISIYISCLRILPRWDFSPLLCIHNPLLPGFTLLLEQSVPGRNKFRGHF